jgi:hypothetical protein
VFLSPEAKSSFFFILRRINVLNLNNSFFKDYRGITKDSNQIPDEDRVLLPLLIYIYIYIYILIHRPEIQSNLIYVIRIYALVEIRFSLFWDVTQRRLVVTDVSERLISSIFRGQELVVVISYRRFKTTCQSFPEGSISPRRLLDFLGCLTLEDGKDRLSRSVANYKCTLRNFPEE